MSFYKLSNKFEETQNLKHGAIFLTFLSNSGILTLKCSLSFFANSLSDNPVCCDRIYSFAVASTPSKIILHSCIFSLFHLSTKFNNKVACAWLAITASCALAYKITTTVTMGIATPAHQNRSSAIPRSIKKSNIGHVPISLIRLLKGIPIVSSVWYNNDVR